MVLNVIGKVEGKTGKTPEQIYLNLNDRTLIRLNEFEKINWLNIYDHLKNNV